MTIVAGCYLAKKADSPFMGSSSGIAVDSSITPREACLSAFRNWGLGRSRSGAISFVAATHGGDGLRGPVRGLGPGRG